VSPPSPLISAEELLALVSSGAPELRIVDVRWYLGRFGGGVTAYTSGHLPGAIHLDLDDDLADLDGYGAPGRHPLPAPDVFAAELAAAGIGDDDLVVAYDDVGGWIAARLWWMLDVLGHERVVVLDGGIDAWTAAGGELTTMVMAWPPAELHLADHWSRVIDRNELRSRLGEVVLIDARGVPRYRGEAEPVDPSAKKICTSRWRTSRPLMR
jgi:thiosulfate/3-mercaptopyruvate sulfurtransferase